MHKFDPFFERHKDLEELDRRCPSEESDTSSVVVPQLVEELERMLNKPSDCSHLCDSEDELEERLNALRTHREKGFQRKLEQWEKERKMEESTQYMVRDLGAVNEQLRDMERGFVRREDKVAQALELEYSHTVNITSDLAT